MDHRLWTVIAPMLFIAFGLFGVNEMAWGGKPYAKIIVNSDPTTGGYVYVGGGTGGDIGTAKSKKLTTDNAENSGSDAGWFSSAGKVSFRLSASKKSGYTFKGWNMDASSNTVLSSNNPWDMSVDGDSKDFWGNIKSEYTYTYYAIFARMAANTPAAGATLNFANTTVTEKSAWQTISIDHAHAGTVTISKTGHADDFFIGGTEQATSELESFESTSETTRTLHVQFRPTGNNLRTCTLTVSSDNGLSSITYYLQGIGYAKPSIKWVNEDGTEVTSGEVTLGKGEIIKATCTTEQTITYSNYNSTYFDPVTHEGGPALRVKSNFTGTFSNLNVRANLAVNESSLIAAYSEDFKLNVTSLTPQRIVWNDDITDLDNSKAFPYYIPLNAVAYDTETNEPSGMGITYSVSSTDYVEIYNGQLKVKAIGGPTTITATAANSDNYAPISVSKRITVSDVKTACATKDTDNGGSFNKNGSHTVYVSTPGKMTFWARRENLLLRKDLTVTEYNSNGGTLHTTTISCDDIGTSGSGSKKEITLQPTTASVKFSTSASYTYYITSIEVERITSVTKDKSEMAYNVYKGMESSAQLGITYSNVPVYLTLKHGASSKWSMDKSKVGGCGKRGSAAVTLTFSAAETGTYTDTLYIKSNTGVDYGFVKLTATVTAVAQFLDTWNIENTYNTTDQTTLSAETTEGKTNFTFSVQSSNPANIVSIDANGVMTFSGSGTAKIKAVCPAYGIYEEFSNTHDITINKVTPTIATNPTVGTVKYGDVLNNDMLSAGLATVTLRGTANTPVDGTFTWTNAGSTVTNDAGSSYDYSVTFTPTNTEMYSNKVFNVSVPVTRAASSLTMKNTGSVDVTIDGINSSSLDLSSLIASQTGDGGITYSVTSANASKATIDGSTFSATACGDYTIHAVKAQTINYAETTADFTVTVNKLTPTIVFDNSDDPEYIYSYDVIEQPAARMYGDKVIDRNVQYVSDDPSITGAIYVEGTTLTARHVVAEEGSSVAVTITASTTEDALYNVASNETHNYAVRSKRSPVFTMDSYVNADGAKTLNIGETATIYYNENTDVFLNIGTASELDYISYAQDTENRTITVTAVKGSLVGDGVQTLTLNQPGTDYLFPRTVVYTFTVQRNVSALSVEGLTTAMYVEDTVATPYTGLANTGEDVQFSCSPEGSMKMEDGKLIALQAGTNTVTFSQPTSVYWTGISQSKTITVSKKNPNMTTQLGTRHPWYSIIEHPFSSLNIEKALNIESSNESLAKYIAEEDKIYVYGTSGNVTFTVNQDENYKYNAVENYQKTFEIFQPNNRLPFTLTSSNLEDYKGGGKGNIKWDGGGVIVYGDPEYLSGYRDWSAKYIILKFVGVPDKLSFDFENTSSIATQYGWHFYQSSNGSDWNLIKEYQDALMNSTGGTSSGSESNLQLDPATQYIKLEYHGNYGGRFKNVHVTERKEIAPRDATKDFGLGYNGNDPTIRAITVDWYNVKPCTVTITGADADKFVLDEGSKTINSTLDHYGTVDLLVSYKHETNTESTHTATLHIEDVDGYYADVTLNGQTTPAPQTIIWRNDLTPMPIEGSFQNAAMVTTGQAVTLVSDHPEIVRVVDNTTLEPVSAGTARVTATAAGNDKWAETTGYLDIEVTTLKVQYITWTDNLSNRKREDGQTVNITLTATSSADMPITYELDEAAQAFASISGNVLSLTGWGSGQVIAKQVGNEEYVAVQSTKTLVSRNPNAKCRPLVGEYKEEYTLHTLAVKEIPIYGEADSVTFWAKCDWSALYGMWVAEEYNGSYHDIQEISRLGDPNITSDYQHYSFPLHRNATAVKLYTKTGATMTRTFKEVEVVLAKYLELADNHMNFSQVDKGSTKTQSFYINYSNLTGVLDVEMENTENTHFTVVTTTVGEDCGDIGQNVRIDISYTGSTLGDEENAILVHNADQSLRIPVTASVVLPSQTITWEPELDVLTTDYVTLSATATSELPVSFTSGNTEIAEVVYEAGVYSLDIKSYGDVEITAHQAGNEDWSAATDKTLTFHISRVVPEVTTWPTAQVILPNTVGGATLIGGVKPEGIPGTFHWEDDSQTVTREAHTFNVVYEPSNTNYYETVSHSLEIEIVMLSQTITWTRADESEEWCASVIALDATTNSNLPITYHSSDSTVAYAENGTLKVLKYGDVTITAEQKGNDTYAAAANVTKTITLKRNVLTLPDINVTSVYVHHFLSNSTFPIVEATAGDVSVGGSLQWQNPNMLMDTPGMNSCTAVFTPNNSNLYEPKECVLSVEVLRFAPSITHNFTTVAADYGVKISELVLNGSGSAVDGYDPQHPAIEGTFEWKAPNHVPLVRETTAILVFRPTRSDWYDEVELPIGITINSVGYIFTGDGEWGTNSNWAEGTAPENVEDVVIQGNVIISTEVEVNNLTIEGGSSVTLTVNGVLTVNGQSADRDLYGDVHIHNNGKLVLTGSADLDVNNFFLDAKLGDLSTPAASGQVSGDDKLNVNGDAYFKLVFDQVAISYGWYDFVVPFDVDVIGGIYLPSDLNTPLVNNVDYAVMEFSEAHRAANTKAWHWFSGTLKAGKLYTITLDETQPERTTYVFKKKRTATFGAANTYYAECTTSAPATDRGWNGLGNGTLRYCQLNIESLPENAKMQIYDHTNDCYTPCEATQFTYAVGTAFFIQVNENNQTISLNEATDSREFRAPSRAMRYVDEFRLTLKAEDAERASDYLWISASEEATEDYVIGQDLLKMGTPTAAKTAQMWATKGGLKLCDIETRMDGNGAYSDLNLYVPQAGSYELTVEKMPEDATLYLTYNGNVIWDLTASPYVLDLTKGTTTGYGLRIEAANAPQITTGVEDVQGNGTSVRKVIIDNTMYIITPEGEIYNAIGKKVQ